MREIYYMYKCGFIFCSLFILAVSKWRLLSAVDARRVRMQMHRRFQRTVLRKKYSIVNYFIAMYIQHKNDWPWSTIEFGLRAIRLTYALATTRTPTLYFQRVVAIFAFELGMHLLTTDPLVILFTKAEITLWSIFLLLLRNRGKLGKCLFVFACIWIVYKIVN